MASDGDKALEALKAHGSAPERSSWFVAADLARELGRLRYAPAVATLAELWQQSPVAPLRAAAGHALFDMGTPEANAALYATRESRAEHLHTFLALKSTIASEGARAFDRLQDYFSDVSLADEAKARVAGEALFFLGPSSFTREGPGWNLPEIPALLRSDPRWVEVAIRLRRHDRLGAHARHLLESLDREEVEAALRRWPDPPRAAPPPYTGPRDFLARYQRGEHVAVWRDLFALGPLADQALREEATAVAVATMQRVRSNVEIVSARLRAAGYPFFADEPPWSPPARNVAGDIRRMEAVACGPVPIALRAFWTVVGEVQWMQAEESALGDPPWDSPASLGEMDPLCVCSVANAFHAVDEWQERRETDHPEVVGPLELELAPDYLHKANISGGPPYAITVPNAAADAIFENEAHSFPFVAYLRHCFTWAGFPGLQHAQLGPNSRSFLDALGKDLLPF